MDDYTLQKINGFNSYDEMKNYYDEITTLYINRAVEIFKEEINNVVDFWNAKFLVNKIIGEQKKYSDKRFSILRKELEVKIISFLPKAIKESSNIILLSEIREFSWSSIQFDGTIKEMFAKRIREVSLIEIPKTQDIYTLSLFKYLTEYQNVDEYPDVNEILNTQIQKIFPLELTTSEKFLKTKKEFPSIFEWIERFSCVKTTKMMNNLEKKLLPPISYSNKLPFSF